MWRLLINKSVAGRRSIPHEPGRRVENHGARYYKLFTKRYVTLVAMTCLIEYIEQSSRG